MAGSYRSDGRGQFSKLSSKPKRVVAKKIKRVAPRTNNKSKGKAK